MKQNCKFVYNSTIGKKTKLYWDCLSNVAFIIKITTENEKLNRPSKKKRRQERTRWQIRRGITQFLYNRESANNSTIMSSVRVSRLTRVIIWWCLAFSIFILPKAKHLRKLLTKWSAISSQVSCNCIFGIIFVEKCRRVLANPKSKCSPCLSNIYGRTITIRKQINTAFRWRGAGIFTITKQSLYSFKYG